MKAKSMTKAQLAEEALLQYKHIVSSSTDMLAILDTSFTYLAANDSYVKAFNMTIDDLIGKTVSEVFGKEFFETVIKSNADRCMAGEEVSYQAWFDFPAYEPKYMDINYYSYSGDDNVVKGFVVNGRDITERKQAEEELAKHRDHLEDLVKIGTEEQKELISLFDLTIDMLCTADIKGCFRSINNAWGTTLGYTKEELLSKPYIDFVHPDDVASTIAEGDKLSQGQTTIYFENRYRCKDGSYKWLAWTSSPNPKTGITFAVTRDITEKKQMEDALKTARDDLEKKVDERTAKLVEANRQLGVEILERKQVEEALRESEKKYRNLVEQINDIAFSSSKDGLLTYVSPTVESMTGYHPDELVGSNFAHLLHPEDLPYVADAFQESLSGNLVQVLECRVMVKSGALFWARASVQPIFEGNQIVGFRGIISNITEHKRAEEAESRAKELDELNRLRSALLASVSHELRTPLAAIKGIADTLIQPDVKWDTETQLDFLRTINRESDILTHIVEDLVEMSQLEAGIMKMEKMPSILSAVTIKLREQLRILAVKHELEINIPRNLPLINIDEIRIGEVITNLVENAASYSENGTRIVLEAQATEDEIIVSITDDGIGIPAQYINKIFDRFYRLEAGVAHRRGGTGLGLSICKAIVEEHGGRIWAESEMGKGTKFSFSLLIDEEM
ncbi:MAG: PAS domain S-box protein [Planctomycetes bacterium]|nr:PAS domain S-box protein [Planctomycetota bacterium]